VLAPLKRILFCYSRVYILVFFHVFVRSLLLTCMLKSSALRVEVQTSYKISPWKVTLNFTDSFTSAIIEKPQQWPTPSESIAIYCVRN